MTFLSSAAFDCLTSSTRQWRRIGHARTMNSTPGRVEPVAGGVLLLDKPEGFTSNAVLQRVRRLFGRIKGGHTGTLDPMATGLLPLCLGEATKFAGYLLSTDKTYEARVRLGTSTDTGDAEGVAVSHRDYTQAGQRLTAVLGEFRGEIQQTPPMYSAIKHQGRPLYEYARAGTQIERHARVVHVHELSVVATQLPDVDLHIHCSKGTY